MRSKSSLVTRETSSSTPRPIQLNAELKIVWIKQSNKMILGQVAPLQVSCQTIYLVTIVVCTSMWTSAHCRTYASSFNIPSTMKSADIQTSSCSTHLASKLNDPQPRNTSQQLRCRSCSKQLHYKTKSNPFSISRSLVCSKSHLSDWPEQVWPFRFLPCPTMGQKHTNLIHSTKLGHPSIGGGTALRIGVGGGGVAGEKQRAHCLCAGHLQQNRWEFNCKNQAGLEGHQTMWTKGTSRPLQRSKVNIPSMLIKN